jgi:hypothetical protein
VGIFQCEQQNLHLRWSQKIDSPNQTPFYMHRAISRKNVSHYLSRYLFWLQASAWT